jgi:hypothetical protein
MHAYRDSGVGGGAVPPHVSRHRSALEAFLLRRVQTAKLSQALSSSALLGLASLAVIWERERERERTQFTLMILIPPPPQHKPKFVQGRNSSSLLQSSHVIEFFFFWRLLLLLNVQFLLFCFCGQFVCYFCWIYFFRIKSFLHPIRCKFVVCLGVSALKKQEALGDFGGRELESALKPSMIEDLQHWCSVFCFWEAIS